MDRGPRIGHTYSQCSDLGSAFCLACVWSGLRDWPQWGRRPLTCSRGAGGRMMCDRLLWGSLGPPTCPRGAGGQMAQGLAPVGPPAADVLTGGRRPDDVRPAPGGQPRTADVPTGAGGRMAHDCCARRDLLPGGQWGRVAPRGPVRVVAGRPAVSLCITRTGLADRTKHDLLAVSAWGADRN